MTYDLNEKGQEEIYMRKDFNPITNSSLSQNIIDRVSPVRLKNF